MINQRNGLKLMRVLRCEGYILRHRYVLYLVHLYVDTISFSLFL